MLGTATLTPDYPGLLYVPSYSLHPPSWKRPNRLYAVAVNPKLDATASNFVRGLNSSPLQPDPE